MKQTDKIFYCFFKVGVVETLEENRVSIKSFRFVLKGATLCDISADHDDGLVDFFSV